MENTNEKSISGSTIRMSLFLLGVVSLLVLANIQSAIGGKHKLLPSDQAISYKFKYLIGGNRLEEYKMLESLIKPTSAMLTVSNSDVKVLEGSFASNEFDIIFLLGQPDIRISNTEFQYKLSEDDSSCIAIIKFNQDRQVISSTIKNCK